MNINILDVLTLDNNNEYTVTRKCTLNGENYFMIIKNEDSSDFKFVKQNNDELEEIEEPEIVKQLVAVFNKQ